MKFLIRYAAVLIAIFSFSIFGPSFYKKVFSKPSNSPTVFYSAVKDCFILWKKNEEGKLIYLDEYKTEYDKKTFETFLPFTYYRDLFNWGLFPEEVNGIKVSYENIRRSSFFLKIRPKTINFEKIRISLNPLFESKSPFSKLTVPDDLFRITDRMEFIDGRTNSINESKSQIFSDALNKAGFKFPAKIIAGNPSSRKAFDYGYFVVDSSNILFHVRQDKGKPFIRKTKVSPDLDFYHIQISESLNTDFYGFIFTKSGDIYTLMKHDYSIKKLPITDFLPDRDGFIYSQDPLNRIVVTKNTRHVHAYAMTHKNEIVKEREWQLKARLRGTSKTVFDIIFPFQLMLKDRNKASSIIKFEKSSNPLSALSFSIFLIILFVIVRWFMKVKWTRIALDSFFILFGGIFSFVGLLLLGKEQDDVKRKKI